MLSKIGCSLFDTCKTVPRPGKRLKHLLFKCVWRGSNTIVSTYYLDLKVVMISFFLRTFDDTVVLFTKYLCNSKHKRVCSLCLIVLRTRVFAIVVSQGCYATEILIFTTFLPSWGWHGGIQLQH